MPKSESIEIKLFSSFDIGRVPTSPGIYAWFLRNPIKAPRTPTRVAGRLRDDLELTRSTVIELRSINTEFKSTWRGQLSLELNEKLVDHYETFLNGLETELFQATIDHFNNIMNNLSPLLYVGKANNLQKRIHDHLKNIERLSQGHGLDFGDPDAREFPERVNSFDIPVDHLRFTFFEFPPNDSLDSLKANEFVEQMINQNLRPRLGKR